MSRRPWSLHPLYQLTLLRLREFVREPEALFWALIFPILLAAGLGVAFRNQPVQAVRIGVTAPELAALIEPDPSLDVVPMDARQAADALRTGRILLVVDAAADGAVVYRYDDTNPEARNARLLANHALQGASGRVDPVRVADDVSRETGSRYIDFLIPGLVGMGIMGNAIWGLGFSIVDARRRKLMKRIVATPMPRHLYLGSFLGWRMILLPVEVGVPILFGMVAFGVPVRGSVVELAAICILGSLSFAAIGLLVASRAKTIEAVSGLMNIVMLPMWILSGVFFSAERFPESVQPWIQALPLTALIDALRASMLQGAGLASLWPQAAILTGWLVVSFAVALKLFRWR
jgi:ABC-type polysaccharide/polyol phosphate export permease